MSPKINFYKFEVVTFQLVDPTYNQSSYQFSKLLEPITPKLFKTILCFILLLRKIVILIEYYVTFQNIENLNQDNNILTYS